MKMRTLKKQDRKYLRMCKRVVKARLGDACRWSTDAKILAYSQPGWWNRNTW